MLRTTGCSVNFERIITSFYTNQAMGPATTLISNTIYAAISIPYADIDTTKFAEATAVLESVTNHTDNLDQIYASLTASPEATNKFNEAFGVTPPVLAEAAPKITDNTIPTSLQEKTAGNFSVTASHWKPTYTVAYEWYVDSVLISNLSTASFTPSANSKATVSLDVYVGMKNSGDSNVNRSKPYHNFSVTIPVTNDFPATAMPYVLNAGTSNPTNTLAINLDLTTGTLGGGVYSNCETFTNFAITENATSPVAGDFTNTCSSATPQVFPYTLTNTADGPITIKIWGIDERGLQSSSEDLVVTLDRTDPVITYTGLQANYRSDRNTTFNWTLTEVNAGGSQNFSLQFYDGTSWSALPNVAVTGGNNSGTAYSTSFNLPNINTASAKLRISYTDLAGNAVTQDSADFGIQAPILGISPSPHNYGSVLNKANSADTNFTVSNTGVVTADSCSIATLSGANASEFSISTDNCGTNDLTASGSCSILVKAIPTTKGAKTASLNWTCGSDSISSSLSYTSINNQPVSAGTESFITNEDTALNFNITAGSDIDGDSITYSIVSNPTNGVLSNCMATNADLNCDYTPSANYNGSDSFIYRVHDGSAYSVANTTVNLTINSINDAPTIPTTQSVGTSEDTPVNFNLNAGSDVDGDSLSYTIVTSTSNGSLSCTGGTSTACTYTPNLNFNGVDNFTYKVNDGTVDSNTAAVTINISSTNDAPVMGSNQFEATNEDTLVSFTLNSATDIDVPSQTLSYKVITAPTNGVLSNCIDSSTYKTDITCDYTPNANYNGSDSFTYKAYDGVVESSTAATVTFSIAAINDAPTLTTPQAEVTNEDTVLNFNLGSGVDIEGSTLTYSVVSTTSSGALSCTGGTSRACTYTPSANYNGSDSFTYKTNDGSLDSNTATVNITVNSINDAPTLVGPQAESTNEDTALNFNLDAGTDLDGDSLSYLIVGGVSNGALSCTGGTSRACVYTPNTNYNGSDSFTYKVNDGTVDSNTITVNITVNSINDSPVLTGPQSQSVNEDILLSFNLDAATDVDLDAQTYSVVSNVSNGVLSCTGGASRACTYQGNANFNGADSFTYKSNDGTVDSNTVTVNITVNSINDAPTLSTPQAQSTNEDVALNFNLGTATDVDGDAQTYAVVSTTTNGSLSCTGGASTACTYTPNANFFGSDSFTYKSNDGTVDSNTATVNITVNSVNDAPVLTGPQAQSTNEDVVLNFNLGAASDIDGDTQSYSVVSTTTNGSLSCTGGASTSCSYTPSANYNGADSFTYKSNDGTVDSNTVTVNITVNSINDVPTLSTPQAQSTNEDVALNFNLGTATDVDGDAQTYAVVSTTTNGSLSCTGGASTACTYTPSANFFGSDSFTYKSNDGTVDSNTATINITVNSVNDAPVLTGPQAQSTNEDVVLNFNLGVATDVDGDTQSYSVVSTTTNGSLSCTGGASTSCSYTPNANYNGADSFTYKSNDGTVDSNTVTVNITVNSINDAPTLVSTQSETTNEDTDKIFLLGIGSDVEGDTLSYIIVSTPTNGGISCVGGTSRTCTYSPNLNFNGTDTFTYKVNDGSLDSNISTVTMTIDAVNDAPVLSTPQAQSTNEDIVLNFNLGTATDVDADAQIYSVVSTTTNGTLSCTGGASTSCSYTPNLNYNGPDSFTYKSNDGTVDSNTATVNITINAVNDAPTLASTQSVSTNEDTVLNFNLTAGADVEGSTLSYTTLSTPINGALSCTGGTSRACSYTPDANYNGTDSFTYKVNDGSLDSTTATVTITINPVNDAPVLASPQSDATNEDVVLNFNLGAASDIEGDAQTYTIVSSTTNGSLSCTGGASTACSYTPNANYNGSDSFTYKSNDGALDSNTATFNLTINAVNDAPVMVADQSFSVNDNTATNFTLSGATDIDVPAQTLTYKVISAPTNGTLSNCITTGGYSSDVTCTYTANTNYNGSDSFTYLANDGVVDSVATKTVSFTVTDVTPPSAPSVTLASVQYTTSQATTYTASTCTDNPFIYFNEGSAPSAGAAGWQACTTTAAALTYTLSASDAVKAVKVWSKDPNGNVSTVATTVNVNYDTTNPAFGITTPTIVKGGASYNFDWTLTDASTSSAQSFSMDYFDGSTWSNAVATQTASNGPLTAAAFNQNYTVSSVNTTAARFRVNFTDLAGNSNSIQSGTFEIDSIAPSIAISTPAASSYHQSSLTMTGTCETGADVNFSGDIQAAFSLTCAGGSFSQLLNLSDNDGNKTITLTHTDPAGNQSTTNRTFIRDEVPPSMAKTTGANPGFTGANNFSWGGTCEGNYTINVTGDETTSFACSAGTWSWTTADKLVDGTFNYNLSQTDGAGNTSTPFSLSWERDGTPPPFTISAPITVASSGTGALTNNLDAITISGNCEGTNSIAITGTVTTATSCSSGSWSYTTPTVSTDGTRGYTFTQSDSASNTSYVIVNWTRDTTGPALTLSSNLIKSNTGTVSFGGGCEDGLSIDVTGAETSSATCNTGSWTWTTTSQSVDATRSYTFTQTNAVPNSTAVSGDWIRETDAPTISAFSTSAVNPTKNANVPVSMTATSQNAAVNLSHICIKTNDNVQPIETDTCWVPINGPAVGLPLAQTLNLSEEYFHLLGWTPNTTLSATAWVKDEAQNISNLTNAGLGTDSVDKFDRVYDPGSPPLVSDVIAANIPNAPNPPTRAQAEVPAGSDVYIRWIATDDVAFPAGTVSLYYSTDEINFTQIGGAESLNHLTNYGCTGYTLQANEGCFKWTGGSPLNTSYKIRVKATDSTAISSQMISNPLNSGLIKIIAGNTEAGLGGSASTAMFFTRKAGSESDPGTLVVTNDGQVFFNDYKRGILQVDPNDGKQKIFIPNTGTSSGDGGPAVNATLRYATKIALDFQNRLLIMDTNRIRRVDLNVATPNIETIIGGGAQTGDTVVNPLDLSIYSHSTNSWTARGMAFFATPNGDIYFHSDYALKNNTVPTYRVRKFNAATGQIESKYFTGNGHGLTSTQDLSKCRLQNPGLRYDPTNSQITGVTLITRNASGYTDCEATTERYSRSYFDPTTFATLPTQLDDSYRYYRYFHMNGMDGNVYVIVDRNYINRVNFDGTYTRVLGQGTRGHCEDGTANLSCKMDIQDLFVTSTGKFYFTDRGQIRTIDSNGNVVTLFGQNPGYGDGVNALNSRFDSINTLARLDNGKIIVADATSYYFKEFTVEGNINIIAGNGNYQVQDTSTVATSQGFLDGTWWLADKATGEIFTRRDSAAYMVKLNRSTSKWEYVFGTGTNEYWNNDGQPGLSRKSGGNQRYSLPIGYDTATKQLLTANMKYNSTEAHWEDFMLKAYDGNDVYRQSHVAGTNDPAQTYVGGYNSICADGSAAATCKMPYWDTWGLNNYWDAANNRWIMMAMHRNPEREVYSITPGGTVDIIANFPRNVDASAIWLKEGATDVAYYCYGSRIYKHNITTNTDLGVLPWQMSNLSCKGYKIDYNPTNNSLIFPFEQNGLYGVGEYFLP
ncbi:MAG: VCBS repeat-containing protein [Bacteriovoracaceae bacterium]|jgi:VCBS repeat-containing protein